MECQVATMTHTEVPSSIYPSRYGYHDVPSFQPVIVTRFHPAQETRGPYSAQDWTMHQISALEMNGHYSSAQDTYQRGVMTSPSFVQHFGNHPLQRPVLYTSHENIEGMYPPYLPPYEPNSREHAPLAQAQSWTYRC